MLELNGRELTPDLSVYPKTDVDLVHDELVHDELVHDEAHVSDPPLHAVEIAGPTQNIQDLINKIEFLLDAGAQSCWLVQPTLQTVTLFAGTLDSTPVSGGSFTDPVLDIEVSPNAIFDPDT